jgi:hypothetical protein
MRLRILLAGIIGLVISADAQACGGRIAARIQQRREQAQQEQCSPSCQTAAPGPVQRVVVQAGQTLTAVGQRIEALPAVISGCSGGRCPVPAK